MQRAIRLPHVTERTGLSKSTIYALIRRQDFPPPAKQGKCSLWDEAAVDAWLRAKFGQQGQAQGVAA